MTDADPEVFDRTARSGWVRLRTLIILRWIAVAGQTVTILAAELVFGFELDIGLCLLAVGASVLANLVAIALHPETKRLSQREAALTLLFDILQLSFLLFLTGGLYNPFALLMLVPVTISATVLPLRPTLGLGALAIALVSALGVWHLPLRAAGGDALELPRVFLFGVWVAIVTGVIFLGVYCWRVTSEVNSMADALVATQMALAREQKLTDLGGMVAAAAHELGTPLATIRLTAVELIDDLADRPDLQADAVLLREQADRCRDIMQSMGQAGTDDPQMRTAPLQAVVEEAAEPHRARGKRVEIDLSPGAAGETLVRRRPEIIHGLRNLIQNAVDFAAEAVHISGFATGDRLWLRIGDDGPGYPPHLLARIGEPYVRGRRPAEPGQRAPAYEGMGLGLFIAKTLLARSGAETHFANAEEGRGARVEVVWRRADLAGSPFAAESRSAA